MKKILLPVLIVCVLIACKSNTKKDSKDSINNKSAAFIKSSNDETQGLIKKFKPILQGVWVKKDYVEKVIKTKSPLAAADLATWITTIYINTDQIEGDSIRLAVGYGNHEGGEITLKFRPGKTTGTISFGGDDLGYKIENADTTLALYQWNVKTNKSVEIKYIKALNKQPEDHLGFGTEFMINKGLISGKYFSLDSSGVERRIVFTNNGKVTGLSDFNNYFIQDDLSVGPLNNLDEIIFDMYSKHELSYSFKIVADTLNLYETKETTDSLNLELGRLKYKLVRQK